MRRFCSTTRASVTVIAYLLHYLFVENTGRTVFPQVSFNTSARPVYTALNPHMIPSHPAIMPKSLLPVKSLAVNRKNSIAKLRKTNCRARFALKVPKNIENVNNPHMKKYAAMAVEDAACRGEIVETSQISSFGSTNRSTNDHQNKP